MMAHAYILFTVHPIALVTGRAAEQRHGSYQTVKVDRDLLKYLQYSKCMN